MAPKIRPYDRSQICIMTASLDDLLEPDHEVRALWEYVQRLDLQPLLDSIRSRRGSDGAPTYDPRILLCLWLQGTSDGVGSARQLERLCREHIVYRWLCADDVPSYHTLSTFRTANGELLDDLLTQSLAILVSEGLVNPAEMEVAHDGIRVSASAGRSSFRRQPTLEKALEEARERVRRLKSEASDNEPHDKRREAAQKRAAQERERRVAQALQKLDNLDKKTRRKDRGEARASTTDPDARRMKMANGGISPGYNIQYTTDIRSRVITGVTIGQCGSDFGLLLPAMEDHARRLGCMPRRVLADKGFVKAHDIIELTEHGCQPLMPRTMAGTKRGTIHEAVRRWKELMQRPEIHGHYQKTRAAVAEWTNAQLRNHGFRRITVRGLERARIIAILQALARNFKQTVPVWRQTMQPG